jgi:hypothetical protein
MRVVLTTIVLAALLLTGCTPATTPAPTAGIQVEDVWGRASPMMAAAGAFYMVIRNNTDAADRLVNAQSSACGVIELHESFQKDDGTMGMQPVTGGAIEVPASGTVELKPGGLHVMCLEKKAEFKDGDSYPLTLMFEKAGNMDVDVAIRTN